MNSFERELEREYGKDKILRENRIGHFMTDFSVIDSDSKNILAVFELKIGNEFNSSQLSGYNSVISQVTRELGREVPVYYVTLSPESAMENFRVNKLVKNDKAKFEFEQTSLPKYNNLIQQSYSVRAEKVEQERREALSGLELYSRGGAVFIFLTFIISKFFNIELTSVDLILVLSVVVCVLLPYVKIISYNDITLGFGDKKDKESNNS